MCTWTASPLLLICSIVLVGSSRGSRRGWSRSRARWWGRLRSTPAESTSSPSNTYFPTTPRPPSLSHLRRHHGQVVRWHLLLWVFCCISALRRDGYLFDCTRIRQWCTGPRLWIGVACEHAAASRVLTFLRCLRSRMPGGVLFVWLPLSFLASCVRRAWLPAFVVLGCLPLSCLVAFVLLGYCE